MAKFIVNLQANQLTFETLSTLPQDQLAAKAASRIIILLHGFPDNNHSFNDVWPLLERNYGSATLILAPKMRGYEQSSQVDDDKYYFADYASDVIAFIENIRANEHVPVHVVGHDWGALAAYKAASLRPDLITSMACLAIPYLAKVSPWDVIKRCPLQIYYSSYMWTMQTRWLYGPRLYVSRSYILYIKRLWRCWSPNWQFSCEELENVATTFQESGVADAATAYYRCLFKAIAKGEGSDWVVDFEKIPTLMLGGAVDGCMASVLYDVVNEKLIDQPNAKTVVIPEAGHFMHREKPTVIAKLVIDWFDQFSTP
jgi:pimeloyl-ACP methyl ester carboxylesterase